MPVEPEIKIKFTADANELEKLGTSLKDKGGFDNPKKWQEFQAAIQQLNQAIKLVDPSKAKDLASVGARINEVVDLIVKAGVAMNKLTPEVKDLYDKWTKIGEKSKIVTSAKQAQEGRFVVDDTKSGKDRYTHFQDSDSVAKSILTQADAKLAVNGKAVTNWSTMQKYLGQNDPSLFKSPEDYARAQNAASQITGKENEARNEILKTEEELKIINGQLDELNKQLEAAKSNLPGEAQRAIEIQGQTGENIKNQGAANIRNAQTGAAIGDLGSLSAPGIGSANGMGKALKQFTLYAVALRTIKKALNEAKKTVRELDRALTEQAMVTNLTRKQTYGLLQEYQNMASRLGTTTKEVSSTMTQFLRQGRSINESLKLTEAAVSAAKVAGISAADSINYLTTAINGFRLSANDAMKVSDKFAAVAATAATSYEEIAIALSKVAAQANLAGMSIDYTTALLTKGIETTREAPETIGTALKTVIARMREMTDYGETLEGDTNINNVEAQLAYIGIQLRDNNGELRSTEDVLNDLGGQWDKLNANQQAAIAKALAGTRQQSRLIAMMQDYERVIELQQISERSAGATAAQMETYLQGMDAAMNKVNVAWETLVSNIVNNDAVIAVVDLIGTVMQTISENLWLLIPAGVILLAQGTQLVQHKLREMELTKLQLQIQKDSNKIRAQERLEEAKKLTIQQKAYVTSLKMLQTALEKKKAEGKGLTEEEAKRLAGLQEEINLEEQKVTVLEEQEVAYQKSLDLAKANAASIDDWKTSWKGLGSSIASAFTMIIPGLQNLIHQTQLARKEEAALNAQKKAGLATDKAKATTDAAGSGAKIPYVGWIIWAIIMGSAVITAVAGAIQFFNNLIKSSADKVNDLSNEIYTLNKKSTSIEDTLSKFEDLDKKIIKTSKDAADMADLLEKVGDSLSDEEKKTYEKLSTEAERINFLRNTLKKTQEDLAKDREDQRQLLLGMSGQSYTNLISGTDAKSSQNRDALRALNNAELYKQVDAMEGLNEGTEKLVQTLLEQLPIEQALAVLRNPQKIQQYIYAVQDGVEVFMDESKSLKERVEAYKQLRDSLTDPAAQKALKEAYSEWETFANTMSESALDFIANNGGTIDGINSLGKALNKLGYDSDETTAKLDELFDKLEHGHNLRDSISDIFGVSSNSEEYKSILDAYDKTFGTTILNMGQNIDKFRNTIDSFYEKASKWSELSDTDKTAFLSENALLFAGEDGEKLLRAFESGNYAAIATALSQNEALTKQRTTLLKDVNRQLEIELARSDEERDHAYIAELQAYKKQLEDLDKVYLASLKLRYDQQKAQIDAYKELLQKETDALTNALEKRKEAYQKYFDDINKIYEQEEYQQDVDKLIENISKLSSSTNADAMAKSADLAKQLEDLEKERIKTLREQAQEEVISNIEDKVTEINDNLEKLLNNEQALLEAMMTDAKDPEQLIASLMSAQAMAGNNTELGMQSYLQEMKGIFGAIMPNVDWGNVDVQRNGDSLILNVNGNPIELNESENQTIYDAIYAALRQIGRA